MKLNGQSTLIELRHIREVNRREWGTRLGLIIVVLMLIIA
jgi:hypothetical protein